jgi:sugar lactone lactonase YvrE
VSETTIVLDPSFRTLCPLAHCEGIATGPDGALWAGDEQGRIHRIDPDDGSTAQIAEIDDWALGLCLDARGRLYVCGYAGGRILRVDPGTGAVDTYADGLHGPNWALFAPDGTLCVSASGTEDLETADGAVLAIPPGGGAAQPLDSPPLNFANGMALAADGTLYVIESYGRPRVQAYSGGEWRTYAELPGTVPDGLALDEEGGLLVSVYQPNRVLRIPPGGGAPELLLDDWTGSRLLTPTNIAFFGPERRGLAIASLCGWSISAIDTPWRGQPLFYPDLP